MSEYQPPVNQLLQLGQIEWNEDWLSYAELGITYEDIPALIRMATDMDLNREDPDSREVWAPMHAWRALGQLRAVEAIQPCWTCWRCWKMTTKATTGQRLTSRRFLP